MDNPQLLKDIFLKPVDRPIDGVIKADDQTSLRLELEEYVLTNEVAQRLNEFLVAYGNYHGANGVWVSGFFGSGKSHLLKMLAYLLENHVVNGIPTLDFFLPKCREQDKSDAILEANLKKAVAIPSKSILFNIDQKADVISKTQIDALLSVFVKVFDEMCGYYGKQAYIAQYERELDERGQYQAFKAAFEQLTKYSWERGREQSILESRNIAKAYAQVTGQAEDDALGVLDKYRAQHKVSIEDFANQVNQWLGKQEKNFRLNFFVDEVGQYIADNVKLMTNLQTIAESLATKCNGRAWVIVTAQENIESVIGEMSKQQGNDFSRVQARFANRMKLTSTDVAEVIQKRLLAKKPEGQALLATVYQQQANNFKTLFDFADGGKAYRNFKDSEHFIYSYPFIPYQFALFQAAIQQLSANNAFEGKHSSVGERSMLGVFRQVAMAIADYPVGRLATFDLMFEGIRTALKSNIQRAILQAEQHLGDPFAVKVLKTLFLVKYVKDFKSTLRNLSVLMLEEFNQDITSHRQRLEHALNLLEQQTYIQRHGEFYEYLTDTEKDVETEIKNTDVDINDVVGELQKIVFDQIIKQTKIRYSNQQDYPFTRKMDGRLYGREYELIIHVISPFNDDASNHTQLRMQSMGFNELRVIMPADARLMNDLLMYKRTEKYVRQNTSLVQKDGIQQILGTKALQNQERLAEISQRVQRLVGESSLVINGGDIDISSTDGQSRIISGFHQLIEYTYTNLSMLRSINYSENDIGKYLNKAKDGLLANDVAPLTEAEQEILAFIKANQRNGGRTTIKAVIDKFERKNYGWYYAAILCNLAMLAARGKIELRSDGNLLEDAAIERALRNSQSQNNVIIDPQIEFSPSQIRALKDFYNDFFDKPAPTSEAKLLAKETADAFKALFVDLDKLHSQKAHYPFLATVSAVLEKIKPISQQQSAWFFTELPKQEEALYELKENITAPVLRFMNGAAKSLYDQGNVFLSEQNANLNALDSTEVQAIKLALADARIYQGNKIQLISQQLDALKTKLKQLHTQELEQAVAKIEQLGQKLRQSPEFAQLNNAQQQELMQAFEQSIAQLGQQQLIAVIRDNCRTFEEKTFAQLADKLHDWLQPKAEIVAPLPSHQQAKTASDTKVAENKVSYVKPSIASRDIKVNFAKAWLVDESDVDHYLKAMREALLNEINTGKRINL